MKSKASFLGHPVHPMLITFPVGLLVTAVIFELIGLIGGDRMWDQIAFYMVAAGVIGGLVAGIFGFVDYLAIPAGTRAKGVATMHGGGNLAMLVIFAIAWLVWLPAQREPNAITIILTLVGVAAIGLTGWLGGELVDRLGVGVDPGANMDAPNSLGGLPASSDLPGQEHRVQRGA